MATFNYRPMYYVVEKRVNVLKMQQNIQHEYQNSCAAQDTKIQIRKNTIMSQ